MQYSFTDHLPPLVEDPDQTLGPQSIIEEGGNLALSHLAIQRIIGLGHH